LRAWRTDATSCESCARWIEPASMRSVKIIIRASIHAALAS
jgi:hypothetical protein